ncbi:hypothetical protein IQ215_12805 [Cyanobacterium stanieri LEGE 03274]|uniref:Uncharacterized protein n=1 Tax=Cyanobacterium stanieri LEGE 03274 TaxID=1828756 RepID=A0ABR9V6S3_9CHRO|nr:hypothetical protein [Cyanobacterium stanieri]MBE9223577.1 hypothetical protein [Cyanobacterium stanieri LEGE 03274]
MDSTQWEQEEAKIFQPGTPVQLKQHGGKIYHVEEYDPMLVPPIWLEEYPKPCYPEELRILSDLFCVLPQKTLQIA